MTDISKDSETPGCNSLLTWSEDLLSLSDLSADSGPLKVDFEHPCPSFFYGPATLSSFGASDHTAYLEERIEPSRPSNHLPFAPMVEDGTHIGVRSHSSFNNSMHRGGFRNFPNKINPSGGNSEARLKSVDQDTALTDDSRLTVATAAALERSDGNNFASLATPRTPTEHTPGSIEATDKDDLTSGSPLGTAYHGQFDGLHFARYLANTRSSTLESFRKIARIPEPPDVEVRLRPSERFLPNESKIYSISSSTEIRDNRSFQAQGESIVVARDHKNIVGTSRVVCGRKYREYPCPDCQKLFARPSTLLQHQREYLAVIQALRTSTHETR
ncbi:hypothetical protein PtB15_7B573 [Puccinia triticina]|nr:hypothetical protein PtB15_7B573 [Puccinia triticina]